MKLLFRQRFFSWLDSYDVFDEHGETAFTVEGQLAWGHPLHILDRRGEHVGTVKERIMTLLPKFEIYVHDEYAGCISKELTFFKPVHVGDTITVVGEVNRKVPEKKFVYVQTTIYNQHDEVVADGFVLELMRVHS